MDDNMRIIKSEEELKIFSDPYRLKIINTYQTQGLPLTVTQCAKILGEVPAKVHYHVKKLIKINILELDHIELIKGINAKYYKLPKSTFTIQVEDGGPQNLYKQLNQTTNLIVRLIDGFKDNFILSSQRAVEEKIQVATEVGFLTVKDIFLSEEEFKHLNDFLIKTSDNKIKFDKDKKHYSFIAGLSRKLD